MEELAKRKEKHNHKWTNLLKLAIFFTIMLAPFLAVLSKCMYVSLNKNAKDSYSGTTTTYQQVEKYETNNPNILADLHEGYVYTLDIDSRNEFSYSDFGNGSNLEGYILNFHYFYIPSYVNADIEEFVFSDDVNLDTYMYFVINVFEDDDSYCTIIFYYPNYNYPYFAINLTFGAEYEYHLSFDFVLVDLTFTDGSVYCISQCETDYYEYIAVEQSTLDNVFYYAVDDLQNQTLFNWAKQTGIYTTIETMTTGLGMNSTIAMLLAYWSICTAVYIVFDIIIFTFTKLTHFASD